MAENSKIEWTDHTFNPWIGCSKVSPGCDHCYAEAWDKRFAVSGQAMRWGAGKPRTRTAPGYWRQPLAWDRLSKNVVASGGRRTRVFCASLADVFDNEVDPAWRGDLFALIEKTPHLDWLLLTKRIGNAADMMFVARGGHLPLLPNVWIGASIVNQAEAERDIPKLLAVPAARRFLSMEPLLGSVDIARYMWPVHWHWDSKYRTPEEAVAAGAYAEQKRQGLVWADSRFIDWVIVGGESGPHARPMHPDWARSLRDQCNAAGVPFFFKQWGEWCETSIYSASDARMHLLADGSEYTAAKKDKFGSAVTVRRVGKKAAGRLLDGRTWDEVPGSATWSEVAA